MVYPVEEYKGKNKADKFIWEFLENNFENNVFSFHGVQFDVIFIDCMLFWVDNGEIYGNYILIKHSDIFFTKYCHLLSSNVSENEIVKIGECIGKAGKSGWTTGSHLHFEIIKNNKNIDPMKLF